MANQEDSQEDEYGSLREEFRQIIVPLINKSLHDKPTDVAMYCARYFHALVEERQKSSISENEDENTQQNAFSGTGEMAHKGEPVSHVQESTSLPTLTDVHLDRLSLRETSSWSSPSDSSSMPQRLWDVSCDVADAMSCIGDQPNKNVIKEDSLHAENFNAKESNNQLFAGDEGRKDGQKEYDDHERNSNSSLQKAIKSPASDEGIASPVDSEGEEEISAIVNSASSSTDATPGTTYRKKWSPPIALTSNITFKSEFHDTIDGEEIVASNSNSKQCFQKDDMAESPQVPWGSTSHNASFVSIPQLKELANLAGTKQNSATSIQKEIEDSVKLISESLQELGKVLDSMKFYCNEKLQRIKMLKESLPEKSQRAPRKKRSVTTFSSSDNLFESNEFSRGPGNKPATSTTNRGPGNEPATSTTNRGPGNEPATSTTNRGPGNEPATSTTNKVCSQISQKLKELKSNDFGVESDLLGSGHPLNGKKDQDEFPKHEKIAPTKEINAGTRNDVCSKGNFLDQNLEKNGRNVNESRTPSKDTSMNGKSRSKEGFLNNGFIIDDSNLYRRNRHLGPQQHYGQNSSYVNEYGRRMLAQMRIPKPSSGRNSNLTRHHNPTPRQIPGYRFSYIGEGGDVFSTSRRQCSVATETMATQTTERAGNFDASSGSSQIHPVANDNTEQETSVSEQVKNDDGSHVSEIDLYSCTSLLSDEQSSKLSEENAVQTGFAAEETSTSIDKEVEAQEKRTEIKPAEKSSSSLNPCAECFNPPSKLVQNLEALKSSEENDIPNLEQENSDFGEAVTLEPSIKSFPEAAWECEMFLEDLLLGDQDLILYQDLESNGRIVSLTMEQVEDQHKFEDEVCATDHDLFNPVDFSYENRPMQGCDGTSSCAKKEESKKHVCKSDMKLAEGDQGSEAAEEGAERCDSSEKREEPGLSSACGDFVVADNNIEGGENSVDDAENVQVASAPGANDFILGIPEFPPVNADDNTSQNRRQEEEMELNFACFSGSDSSEIDSSDISEEEGDFSGANNENKLKEKA